MFGQYAILESKEHHFEKEPDWFWRFAVVTSADEVGYAQWQDENLRRVEVDDKIVTLAPMGFEAAWRELAITFEETNVPNEKGDPIITKDMSLEEKEAILQTFPGDMIAELWRALKKVYPFWGPRLVQEDTEKAEDKSGETDPS